MLLERLGVSLACRPIFVRDEKDGGCVVLKAFDAPEFNVPRFSSVGARREGTDLNTSRTSRAYRTGSNS